MADEESREHDSSDIFDFSGISSAATTGIQTNPREGEKENSKEAKNKRSHRRTNGNNWIGKEHWNGHGISNKLRPPVADSSSSSSSSSSAISLSSLLFVGRSEIFFSVAVKY